MSPRAGVAAALLILLLTGPSNSEDELPLAVRVNRAIDRSAEHLVSKQAEDGSWRKDDKVHPLGRTALCTFALLHAGYPVEHPAVKKALGFLGVGEGYGGWKRPISVYEAGCLALMLNALGKGHGRQIREICTWLADNFNQGPGLWGYPAGTPDVSNTQYAALAFKAGARHGYRAPAGIWKRLIDSVIRMQSESGAIRYRGGSLYRATMTHAGALILLFASEALGMKRLPRDLKEALEKAHRWFAEHYSVERNPFGRGWHKSHYYYYMYGLERYAVLFGYKEIAGHDWYEEGAEELLKRQEKNGSWGNLEETAFAILFLRRATFSEPEVRMAAPGEPGDGDEPEGPGKPPRPERSIPYLRDWLIAGPYLSKPGEDEMLFSKGFDPRLPARPGGRAGRKKWELHRSTEDKIDIGKALLERPWCSYYAAVYLHAREDTDAVLWLASDDGLRAWLGGEHVLFGHHHGYSGDDFYRVPVKLPKGRSLLILQIENTEYYAHFRARISDAEGKPHAGVVGTPSAKSPKWR